MGRKLYVGNLPYSATEQSLREAFAASGTVDSVSLITDRDTGATRNFGFVTMADRKDAPGAIRALHQSELDGHRIVVNVATERR